MRLSWKLFFVTTPLFVLFLTAFGVWMIQDSFQSSLDKEIGRCMAENRMFQNSYELTLNGLSEEQRDQTTVRQVVESFYDENKESGSIARIYGPDGDVLYQDGNLTIPNTIREQMDDENNTGYELVRQGNRTYLVALGRSSQDLYMETTQDITRIFEERAQMYSRYRIGVLALTLLVGSVTLFFLFLVTRNVQKLSKAARQFARGNYDARANIRSTDEIGMLAADFNWMADTMDAQMQRLQDEVKRQEEFTAAFAHELKTPLTSIIGYADTIRQMELSPEENDMCADYIYHQGKRLQSLSYKLLEMTMADGVQIIWKVIPTPEFFEEIRRTTVPALKEKSLSLSMDVENGILYGDRDLLSSLFINLIDNARKASPEGRTIYLTGRNLTGGGYSVTVEDEGPGLAQEELSRIAEPFYMVDKSRSRKEGGAGLGLALCRKIIDLHEGTWKLESEPGHGLKVTVQLGMPRSVQESRQYRRELRRAGTRERRHSG